MKSFPMNKIEDAVLSAEAVIRVLDNIMLQELTASQKRYVNAMLFEAHDFRRKLYDVADVLANKEIAPIIDKTKNWAW